MEGFDITIVYQFAHFVLLMILLNYLLFKPVIRTLTKREETMSSLAGKVEKAKDEARDFEKQYVDTTKAKQKPLLESKDAAILEAHATAMKSIEKARLDLSEELTRIKGEIEAEGKRVFESLRLDVNRLSTEAAEKILKRSV